MSIGSWKPAIVLTALTATAGAVVNFSDVASIVTGFISEKTPSFRNEELCSYTDDGDCVESAARLQSILEKNVGSTIDADFIYQHTPSVEYSLKCSKEVPDIGLETFDDGQHIGYVPLSFEDCKKGYFLNMTDAVVVQTAQSWIVLRVKGEYTVKLSLYGGIEIYTLIDY